MMSIIITICIILILVIFGTFIHLYIKKDSNEGHQTQRYGRSAGVCPVNKTDTDRLKAIFAQSEDIAKRVKKRTQRLGRINYQTEYPN